VDLDTQTLNLDMFEHILVKAGRRLVSAISGGFTANSKQPSNSWALHARAVQCRAQRGTARRGHGVAWIGMTGPG